MPLETLQTGRHSLLTLLQLAALCFSFFVSWHPSELAKSKCAPFSWPKPELVDNDGPLRNRRDWRLACLLIKDRSFLKTVSSGFLLALVSTVNYLYAVSTTRRLAVLPNTFGVLATLGCYPWPTRAVFLLACPDVIASSFGCYLREIKCHRPRPRPSRRRRCLSPSSSTKLSIEFYVFISTKNKNK